MLAIPSPDLVLNLVASAGQALGLAALLVGRLLWTRSRSGAAGTAGGAGGFEEGDAGRGSRRLAWTFGILLVATAAAFLFSHLAAVDARNQRLRTNLVRTSVEGGREVGDTSLKTLSLSDQLTHPRGLDAATLAAWITDGRPLNLVDVREPEEVETGRIPGSWARRYPDLRLDPSRLRQEGKTTVLLCHSGNRSSELCDEFAAKGIETRFLIGGYEKWIAEGLPLEDAGSREELRSIPDYRHRLTLLDTPEVLKLVQRENALFVDVRYPEEFGPDHLPDAVDLPIRRMPTDAMWAALKDLPDDRPIVAPCYDKRSSFYAEVLGLRLTRLGKDFRGRYTVPHEFWLPSGQREHVAAWHAQHHGRSFLGAVAMPLASALGWMRVQLVGGSLALAILCIVFLLRASLLPFTLKADRDQIVQRRLKPILRETRARLAADPRRAARAVLELQGDEGLTPMRNLVGSMAQIVLFAALFAAVDRAATGSAESMLWIPALGQPDPRLVLPVLTGLYAATLVLAGGRATRPKILLALVFGGGLIALCLRLKAAVTLYLVLNLGFVLVQGFLVRRHHARAGRTKTHAPPRAAADGPIVPLVAADRLERAGGKAGRLAPLARMGLPVPAGFVLDESRADRIGAAELLAAFDALGATTVAVRSSGANEDGADRSYAGVFETELGVTRDGLVDAVARVRASLRSERARAYGSGQTEEAGSIVVQEMVPARYAGVVFSEDPGCSGAVLVELVEGLGESLVSGAATPRTLRFGRRSGRLLAGDEPPVDLAPLLAHVRAIEARFGRPQDVEWAWDERGFHVLQARDITVTARDGRGAAALVERERRRLLDLFPEARTDEVVLEQNELAELLPRPTTLSLALMRALWAPGGTVDLACRAMGVPYAVRERGPELVQTAFGALVVDVPESQRRQARGLGAVAAFRLARGADEVAARFQRWSEFARRESRLRSALALDRLALTDLLGLARESWDRFVLRTYVEAERVNIAADYTLNVAREKLQRAGLDPAVVLAHLPETVVHRAHAVLADPEASLDAALAAHVALFGHRAAHDFELSAPRVFERPEELREKAARLRAQPGGGGAHEAAGDDADTAGLGRVLSLCVERARRFQALKEEAKHETLRELAHLRALLVAIGEESGMDDLVFELEADELWSLTDDDERIEALAAAARERREERRLLASIDVPTSLTPGELETLGAVGLAAQDAPEGALQGARVAGDGSVVGVARVLRSVQELDAFRDEEILVVRCTDPDWTPLFARASGIVSEVGGWLSHAAIQAREYGLPAIVGVRGALQRIQTGDVVRLDTDGVVSVLAERRRVERIRVDRPVSLEHGDVLVPARLIDVGPTGLRLVLEDRELAQGTACRVRIDAAHVLAGRAVSNGRPGHVGLALDEPLPPDLLASIREASAVEA